MSTGATRLYTPQLLDLAVRLSDYPWDADLPLQGEARSPSCGSIIALSLSRDAQGRIDGLGVKAHACAVGQAAGTLFAASAKGTSAARIERTVAELTAWLAGEGPTPDWPGIEALAAAREHRGRHGAILLPWKAALTALSNSGDGS